MSRLSAGSLAGLIAAMLALGGCASSGEAGASGRSLIGFASGDSGAGNRASATIISAMGSGLLGGSIGSGLNESDKRRALEAEYQALEYAPGGQPVTWESGNLRGEVIAYQPYRVGSQDCRQYVHTVQSGGVPQSVRGTACRNTDGSWMPV